MPMTDSSATSSLWMILVLTHLATATALTTLPALTALRKPQILVQRSNSPRAQQLPYPWISVNDPQTGQTYDYNEQTGQSQWDPPFDQGYDAPAQQRYDASAQQQGYDASPQQSYGYGTQVLVSVAPSRGVCLPDSQNPVSPSICTVGNGEEQALGRYEMLEQSIYVSRKQCVVRVAFDGTTTLVSVGKPPTLVRADVNSPWYALQTSGDKRRIPRWILDRYGYKAARSPFLLSGGEQVGLDIRNSESAVFMVQQSTGGGYGMEY